MPAINLKELKEQSTSRPPGYYEDVTSKGTIQGEYLNLTNEAYQSLVDKYSRSSMGLGDLVHKVASPIAGMIDRVIGTNLKNCNSCKQRRETLNKIRIK